VMEMLTFTVHGTPRPQGSMALFRARNGHEVAKYAATVYEWRGLVTVAARAARPDGPILAGPLRVSLGFELARPRSHFGTGRNAGTVKTSAPGRPYVAPDLDKLARAVLDGITDAGTWWTDDGQIAALTAAKTYCREGHAPGVVVTISAMTVPACPATGGEHVWTGVVTAEHADPRSVRYRPPGERTHCDECSATPPEEDRW
jgi:Holliday junction resolvase RusA-like endonuclease